MLGAGHPPSGLFCYNDRMAMGAYRAAAELGLSIPGDLSVVGFDDQELIAASLHPGLTTVALPHYGMGAWAASRLIDAIEGGSIEAEAAGAEQHRPGAARLPAGHPRVSGRAAGTALTRAFPDLPARYAHRELLLFAMRDVLRTVYS